MPSYDVRRILGFYNTLLPPLSVRKIYTVSPQIWEVFDLPLPPSDVIYIWNHPFSPCQNIHASLLHFSFETFCGTTGGVLGLFTGFSVVTFIEVFYLFCLSNK